MERLPVLVYDGDCGFCTRSARLAERLPGRFRLTAWQEADLAALRITEDRARHEVVWVDVDGRRSGGAAAVADLLKTCRSPWSLLGHALSAPVVRLIAELVYRWVAANRYRLPGSTPACRLPRQERPGFGR
ncbi:thiol-disulfide oxidoreductase DCC family protein [Saccharopolyspora taberi]|uniref:Thiol-disulfide oxidoreductase DCC family protein n=1 Tax=Saccharopolyspora taberi TaxID=60895 RepID=A0ABN3V710_9PSEU